MITAHTELSMMLKRTAESTIPTRNPILRKRTKCYSRTNNQIIGLEEEKISVNMKNTHVKDVRTGWPKLVNP